MGDTTLKKLDSRHAPSGAMGQRYLVSGKRVALRLWRLEPEDDARTTTRAYETVGYVIEGRARLELEGQQVELRAGDSWLVPAGSSHRYVIVEPFLAVEATAPPAQVKDRDAPP